MDDIKDRLGSLADANEVEEEIGPAPDGFESPDTAGEPVQAQPVRPQPGQAAAPMAKAPQKMPAKMPAQPVKMPVKRPMPAG